MTDRTTLPTCFAVALEGGRGSLAGNANGAIARKYEEHRTFFKNLKAMAPRIEKRVPTSGSTVKCAYLSQSLTMSTFLLAIPAMHVAAGREKQPIYLKSRGECNPPWGIQGPNPPGEQGG